MARERQRSSETNPDETAIEPESLRRGRGARTNKSGRFEPLSRRAIDDGWSNGSERTQFRTEVRFEKAKTIISTNTSPDIPFDQSINPYRGCEHGCSYCYARPTHAFMGHSPGLDFETKLYTKRNAAECLRNELAKPSYVVKTIALGTNTDPYQPIERRYAITRQILEVMAASHHPVTIVTKSGLILRDLDILTELAADNLVRVALSITTLDNELCRKMEPRAAAPHRRLEALTQLSAAGIPTHVMVAPIVPGLNDHEIERILEAARDCGARSAEYVLLRLPIELKQLFREWLASEFPDRARRIIGRLQSAHGGNDYRSEFSIRQRGSGPYAEQIAQRFALAKKRMKMNDNRPPLNHNAFRAPGPTEGQLQLF